MENIELALFILAFMCLSNSRLRSIITPMSFSWSTFLSLWIVSSLLSAYICQGSTLTVARLPGASRLH